MRVINSSRENAEDDKDIICLISEKSTDSSRKKPSEAEGPDYREYGNKLNVDSNGRYDRGYNHSFYRRIFIVPEYCIQADQHEHNHKRIGLEAPAGEYTEYNK